MRFVAGLVVAALVLAGAGAAGPLVLPPQPEQLLEGHTVFTVLEAVRPTNTTTVEEHFAAAVAVLVREYNRGLETTRSTRFPGVLWFNDQYLVEPASSRSVQRDRDTFRYPCSGAVLAVNAGDPVPRDADGVAHVGASTYIESYLITDVHDHAWNVDRWQTPAGRPLWSVAILGLHAGYVAIDDEKCNGGTFGDSPCGGRFYGCALSGPPASYDGAVSTYVTDPGDHGYRYPCGGSGEKACNPLEYNAVLYFRLKDLVVQGVAKNHTEGATSDWSSDVAGCQESAEPALEEWPCPASDDDREGNSHPYNPDLPWPAQTHAGRGNHGGSADCGGADGARDAECHATRRIDVYFGYGQHPAERNYWLVDVVGRSAPYHCHEDIALCGPEDLPT